MDLTIKGLTDACDCKNIEEIRKQIDMLDALIIKALGIRFKFVKEVVKFKNKDFDSIKAQDRYDAVLKERRRLAEENGLNADIIEDIYKQLIDYFIHEEMKIIRKENE